MSGDRCGPAVPLLEVQDLIVEFSTERGWVRVVDGLSLAIGAGETVGLVGESGCGKSATALAILGLITQPRGRVSGSVRFNGRELIRLPERELRRLRGREIAMVFQDPMTSLNPVRPIVSQMTRVLRLHRHLPTRQARKRAEEMLALCGIGDPQRCLAAFPHQLSGGMRQRVMIAMALSCEPKLLLADEPTSALDVTVQAQVLEQLGQLQAQFGTAVLMISHDLSVIARTCQRALVMYCGQVIEESAVEVLFGNPGHPYTEGLLASIPRIGAHQPRLPAIAGQVPEPSVMPRGCRFAPRCRYARTRCHEQKPELKVSGPGTRRLACFHPLADQNCSTEASSPAAASKG